MEPIITVVELILLVVELILLVVEQARSIADQNLQQKAYQAREGGREKWSRKLVRYAFCCRFWLAIFLAWPRLGPGVDGCLVLVPGAGVRMYFFSSCPFFPTRKRLGSGRQ